MRIEKASQNGKKEWNEFVRKHYPAVGGFMQSWEWGSFQERLGRSVERYFVFDGKEPVAAFTLIYHALPSGFRYGYAARGPVVATSDEGVVVKIFETIKTWARKHAPDLIFLRLEPPISDAPAGLDAGNFQIPSYYVQPRHNLSVPLSGTETEILLSFHPSTRSNVGRAEKRGVTVDIRAEVAPDEYERFQNMMRDTITRNSGVNAYPSREYFEALFEALSESEPDGDNSGGLSLGIFRAYHDGDLAATHFVLFFGSTATYLYGASYTKHLNSKAPTYLHWAAMQEAKRRGMRYYDLGGIDANLWPKLTEFKRQFRGEETTYVGNIDIPLRPLAYRAYNLLRKIKK